MHIQKNLSLKELSNFFSQNGFIKETLAEDKIYKLLNSHNNNNKVEAMKNLICKVYNGEEYKSFTNDVIKIIETRDIELKRLTNLYLKISTRNEPTKQLMCVNTFLKDLNDKNNTIKGLTLDILPYMGDEIILNNYINSIKRLVEGTEKIRMKLIDCILGFYKVSKKLFIDNNLHETLKALLQDENESISLHSLEAISYIEKDIKILDNAKILNMIKKFENSFKIEGISYLLRISCYRKLHEISVTELLKYLKYDNILICYYASTLLLAKDLRYRQVVFDTLLHFLNSENELVYLVLGLMKKLLNNVVYDNSNFLVYDQDPPYLAKRKIEILFFKLDSLSLSEINRLQKKPEMISQIVKYALANEYIISDIFDKYEYNRDIVDSIYNMYPFAKSWDTYVIEYITKTSQITDKQFKSVNDSKKYMFLCGIFSRRMPVEIINLTVDFINNMDFEVIKLNINLYKRKIISLENVLDNFNKLKKEVKIAEKLRFTISIVESEGIENLYQFSSNKDIYDNECEDLKVDFINDVSQGSLLGNNDILNIKPYCGNEYDVYTKKCCEENDDNSFSLNSDILTSGNLSTSNTWLELDRQYNFENGLDHGIGILENDSNIIDTPYFKGNIDYEGKVVFLNISIFISPVEVRIENNDQSKTFYISKEEKIEIFDVNEDMLNTKFKMHIKNRIFEYSLDIFNFLKPLQCNSIYFEEEFQKTKDYILVDEFDLGVVYILNEASFAFTLFNHSFFGKSFSNQILIKGKKEILKKFQEKLKN